MTARGLLSDLRAQGVRLRVQGEALAVDAPTGALAEADWSALTAEKTGLVELLEALVELEADGTAAGIRTTWGGLPATDRGRLQDEAASGDRLADLILAVVEAGPGAS